MGRALRFFKIITYLTGTLAGTVLFSAFNKSPDVEMGLGEGLQKNIIQQIKDGQNLTNKLMSVISSEFKTDQERTQWFHQKVEQQKKYDSEVNQRRENSYIYHHNGKKWVFIEGKYYEYNPKNTYVINGVKTFYEPHRSDKKPPKVTSASRQKVVATQVVRKAPAVSTSNTNSNPLKVYTRTGMAQLKQNLNQIQVQMNQRNEALKRLSKEP